MSAHTPGPWTILNATHPGIEAVATSVATSVVVWGGDEDEAGVHGDTPEEAFANALLIAAAPDLLRACKAALVQLRERRSFVDTPDRPGDVEHIRDVLRAAIAKATGEV